MTIPSLTTEKTCVFPLKAMLTFYNKGVKIPIFLLRILKRCKETQVWFDFANQHFQSGISSKYQKDLVGMAANDNLNFKLAKVHKNSFQA